MRVVAVINQKGGAGKTTTVMNLGAVAAEHSKVLVVDVDPQQSVSTWATTAERLPEDRALPFDVVSETDPEVLKQIRNTDYDTVFVDTPGSLENASVLQTIVENSDFIIMPTEPAALAMLPLMRTYQSIVEPGGVDYRVVVTQVDSRSLVDATEAQDMLRGAGLKVCKSFIRSYKVHERAPIFGHVVTTYDVTRSTEKAAADYKDVARELFSIWANTEQGE